MWLFRATDKKKDGVREDRGLSITEEMIFLNPDGKQSGEA